MEHFIYEFYYDRDFASARLEKHCLEGLDTYLVSYGYHSQPLYPTIFSIPSLSRPQALTIRTFRSDADRVDYVATGMYMVIEITDKLAHLKRLLLVNFGLDFGNLQCLSRLCNLESITCVLREDSYICGEATPEEALAKAFESFEAKPKIEVVSWNGSLFYGQVDRWPYRF